MPSRLANIAVDAIDPELVAAFWCAALDWQVLEPEDGLVCVGPEGGSDGCPGIDVIPVPEAKVVKNRLHLDLRPADDQQVEVTRLESLGARRVNVGQTDSVPWIVMADPDGNEFCVLSVKKAVAELGIVVAPS